MQKLLLNTHDMDDIHKNIEEYNPNKERKILIVFDDMIANMLSNEKRNPVVTGLFIRGRKLNISVVFVTQSYFAVRKKIKLNSAHYFVMKITNKRELFYKLFCYENSIQTGASTNCI